MNSVKLQNTRLIHKNLLLFHTLIMNNQEDTARKQSHLKSHQKNKIHGNKFNQGEKRPILCKLINTDKGNDR